MITSINTQYKNYLFRSRCEARWAIFFDAVNIVWEYEKEGFDLGNNIKYLPDFWFVDQECFVEIKGTMPESREIDKLKHLSVQSGYWVYLIVGNPNEYEIIGFRNGHVYGGDYDGYILFGICKNCGIYGFMSVGIHPEYVTAFGKTQHTFGFCRKCHGLILVEWAGKDSWKYGFPIYNAGVKAAMSARFEHGEKPNYTTKKHQQ